MSADSLQLHRDQVYFTEGEANAIVQKYDKNGDSAINKEELISPKHDNKGSHHKHETGKSHVVPKAQKAPAKVVEAKGPSKMKLSRSQIKEIFMEHDIDGDGCLSIRELTQTFGFLGSIIPFYKAHYGLAYADADGDGLINEEELEKLIDYAEKTYNRMK